MMHKYDWKRDKVDKRDWHYANYFKAVNLKIAKKLPLAVDLRPYCPPIEDQGNIGSCTGNALVGALEFLEKKDKVPFMDLSRLFVYYNERVIEGTVGEDSGAELRTGIKTLVKQGVCSENTWQYNESNLYLRPTEVAYTEAKRHLVQSYYRLNILGDFKNCLASGFPFVFGFLVYESFESSRVVRTGVMPIPNKRKEALLGGHAVMAVGYNDRTQMFIVRNSWGTAWGDKGYFYMPYRFITSVQLAGDFWTIRRATNL